MFVIKANEVFCAFNLKKKIRATISWSTEQFVQAPTKY